MALFIVLGLFFALGMKDAFTDEPQEDYWKLKEDIVAEFSGKTPRFWGEAVIGVKTMLDTDEKVIALTFDANGTNGDGYDEDLINYLIKNKIPATLFINCRWIDKNSDIFKQLAKNPLFEIENHGLEYKPCSVTGNSVYGIEGTRNSAELVDEVELAGRKIEILTGRKPKFYRSGTEYYDEIGVQIVQRMGYEAVGFSVLGDRGAAYSWEQVRDTLWHATPGSIILMHMNRPKKETADGLAAAIPTLRLRGFQFVKLSDYKLK